MDNGDDGEDPDQMGAMTRDSPVVGGRKLRCMVCVLVALSLAELALKVFFLRFSCTSLKGKREDH